MLSLYSYRGRTKSRGAVWLCACVTAKKNNLELVTVWHKWRVSHQPRVKDEA